MEDRKGLEEWIKDHEKLIISSVIGIGITGITMYLIYRFKSRGAIKAGEVLLEELVKQPQVKVAETAAKVATEIAPEQIQEVVVAAASNSLALPIPVRGHIRNLPKGCHASLAKIAEAEAMNIILEAGQTLVDSYTKGCAAA